MVEVTDPRNIEQSTRILSTDEIGERNNSQKSCMRDGYIIINFGAAKHT